ncbi:MAG: hypothetical protein P1U42_02915 [Phycisphaerales bacterium]|nr:hypothetical protein [Phycisphaerales bacterium]
MSTSIEKYTIRRKFLKLFGAAFHVYDEHGSVIGYCKQKAFKLKEDIRLYTDEGMSEELLSLKTESIIDFGASYSVTMPDGSSIGTLRRKGMKSSFVRDEWIIYDQQSNEIAIIQETGSIAPLARRYIEYSSILFPQRYLVKSTTSEKTISKFRQHFNPIIFRLGVSILEEDEQLDDLLLLGAACLISAIEGRQD